MASIFGSGDFKLESLDFLGDEDELRARARQELLAAGENVDTPGRQDGTDETGSIRVSMDRDGAVEDVDVNRQWSERLSAGEFANALLAAYNAAAAKHMNAAALAAFAAQERGEEPTRRTGYDNATTGLPDPADERVWFGAIWSKLSDNDDMLHRIERGERLANNERTVTGPHGYLTAQLDSRAITGIRGDAELIKSADAGQLRVEALAVFRAAHHDKEGM